MIIKECFYNVILRKEAKKKCFVIDRRSFFDLQDGPFGFKNVREMKSEDSLKDANSSLVVLARQNVCIKPRRDIIEK